MEDQSVSQDLYYYLQHVTECHHRPYVALTAYVAIVITRYLLIAMKQRRCKDDRMLGEIFLYYRRADLYYVWGILPNQHYNHA